LFGLESVGEFFIVTRMQRVQKCFYKKVQKTRKFGKIWLFGLLARFFK